MMHDLILMQLISHKRGINNQYFAFIRAACEQVVNKKHHIVQNVNGRMFFLIPLKTYTFLPLMIIKEFI